MHRLRYTGVLTDAELHAKCSTQKSWYHSYYFDNGFGLRGDYNIGADIDSYGFPRDLSGMKALDIGTGGGWFAFYLEQSGAEVTTVDARGYCDFDVYGRHYNPPISSEGRAPDRVGDDGMPIYYSPVSGAFWIMKEILGSRVRFLNARAYEVQPELFDGQKFDLVFMGALLCHLRDPIGALMAARSVCARQIIATTPVVIGEPEDETLPRQYLPYTALDNISWWLPNEACFRHWFLAAGFKDINIDRKTILRCDLEHRNEQGRVVNADQQLRVGIGFV